MLNNTRALFAIYARICLSVRRLTRSHIVSLDDINLLFQSPSSEGGSRQGRQVISCLLPTALCHIHKKKTHWTLY